MRMFTESEKFIEKHHSSDDYLFWRDLASSHYAKDTISWMNDKTIKFMPKDMNPPNVPQLRPIEKFLAHLAQKL